MDHIKNNVWLPQIEKIWKPSL